MKRTQLAGMLAISILLTGCSTAPKAAATLTPFTHDLFTIEVPDTWHKLEANADEKQIGYFSDNGQRTFTEEAMAAYLYPDIFTKDMKFDAKYCLDNFALLIGNTLNGSYRGVFKERVEFKAADANTPAHCDFEFELFNKQEQSLVETQTHYQQIFIADNDELVIEMMTTKPELTENIKNSLATLKLKGKAATTFKYTGSSSSSTSSQTTTAAPAE